MEALKKKLHTDDDRKSQSFPLACILCVQLPCGSENVEFAHQIWVFSSLAGSRQDAEGPRNIREPSAFVEVRYECVLLEIEWECCEHTSNLLELRKRRESLLCRLQGIPRSTNDTQGKQTVDRWIDRLVGRWTDLLMDRHRQTDRRMDRKRHKTNR